MGAAGFGKDDARAYLSRVVGREVAGSKDLASDEVADVIEALEASADESTAAEPPAERTESDWPETPTVPA